MKPNGDSEMETAKTYVRSTWKWWLISLGIGTLGVALLTLGGCSTVSGLAKDLGAASEGLRDAISQE